MPDYIYAWYTPNFCSKGSVYCTMKTEHMKVYSYTYTFRSNSQHSVHHIYSHISFSLKSSRF